VAPRYEIRVAGAIDGSLLDAFAGLELHQEGEVTLLRGEMDQAALHGLLERVRVLGLELLDVRRARSSPRRRA
jgi:hypothetical protein